CMQGLEFPMYTF
nr:immunoglobulin light chain junction region [Macaca mulatta]MOW07964.1 immunoglobulin light chain junction region [Macaca mulatta]MOW08020.1 immunoglobulin light chain junction region [Macaca mulatta]MOW08786.1 immunoglobulin light chain junction region [Macaca mulatta]MOW08930.1 immunoglobulin light chain junction region [Macaca mulatta]